MLQEEIDLYSYVSSNYKNFEGSTKGSDMLSHSQCKGKVKSGGQVIAVNKRLAAPVSLSSPAYSSYTVATVPIRRLSEAQL
jgi:hypothetical protein